MRDLFYAFFAGDIVWLILVSIFMSFLFNILAIAIFVGPLVYLAIRVIKWFIAEYKRENDPEVLSAEKD